MSVGLASHGHRHRRLYTYLRYHPAHLRRLAAYFDAFLKFWWLSSSVCLHYIPAILISTLYERLSETYTQQLLLQRYLS
jgi:hypothetical protein